MKTVTVTVSSRAEVSRRAMAAFSGKRQENVISFATVDLFCKTLTPKRWEILKMMAGQGPMSIRELARRIDRDVKAVHGDIQALLVSGMVGKTEDGRVEFPYDRIKVAFELKAA